MIRVGFGYDVHKLTEDRKLILAGVEIPFEKGLLGHSDADVIIHALMDALLGAAALGDIGKHFPDTNQKYKGIDSMLLLKEVIELLKREGYIVNNVDCTLVAEKPKIAPFIQTMRNNLSEAMGLTLSCVNVKATTTEGLGFTGTGEGMAAYAVVTLASL